MGADLIGLGETGRGGPSEGGRGGRGERGLVVPPPRRHQGEQGGLDGRDSLSLRRGPHQVAAGAVRSAAMHYLARRDPVGFARRLGVTVGSDCLFVGVGPDTFGSEPYLVRLGDHVAIAGGVRFLTHDGGNWLFQREYPDLDVAAPIVVGDNVLLGINSMIYRGVTIGNDVAVAAGALVMRDVPAGSVVAGAPARVVSSIADYRDRLLKDSIDTGLLRGEQRRQRLLEIYPQVRLPQVM